MLRVRCWNEVRGALGIAPDGIKEAIGVTNRNCLERRADELAALLASSSPEGRRRAPTGAAMSKIIPLADPDLKFDFAQESLDAAINEACASTEEATNCSMATPCEYCLALAKQIEGRLRRAFLAGQASMTRTGD